MCFSNQARHIVFMLLITFVCGCGGDDDNPTTPAPTNADIAGLWTGSGKPTSVSPADHPMAQTLSPIMGVSSPATLAVQKNGQDISARLTWTQSGGYADYVGTFGNSSFTLNGTYSSSAMILGIECVDGVTRDLIGQTDTINGSISGNKINATGAETYNCRISGTNVPDGIIIINGSYTFSKGK